MKKLLYIFSALFNIVSTHDTYAQTQVSPKYSVDGTVKALATKGDTLIVGGTFNNVGVYTGGGALVTDASDKANLNFPKIIGSIYASTPDGAGGFYIYGNYRRESEASNATSGRIEHVMPDFTFEPGFSLSVNAYKLYKILYDNRLLYIAGYNMNQIAGQTVGDLCAIDVHTQLVQSWIPHIDSGGNIGCVAINQNTLYVAGNFTKIGGEHRDGIVAIELNTGAIKPWNVSMPHSGYSDIKFYKNKIILGGGFSDATFNNHACAIVDSVSGDTVQYIFNSTSLYWAAGIQQLAISGDTLFASSNGTYDTRITAVNLASGNSVLWTKFFSMNSVALGLVCSNGSLFVAGTGYNQIYRTDSSSLVQQNVNCAVALDTRTGNLKNWFPNPGGWAKDVYTISNSGNNIFIGGVFSLVNYSTRSGIVLIKTSVDSVLPFKVDIDIPFPTVNNLKLIDSTLYLAGQFNNINGASYPASVLSFNVNTGQLLSWHPANLGNAWTIDADAKYVYLGGSLTEPSGGSGRRNLVAIDRQNGNLGSWSPNPDRAPNCLYISNGILYTCGNFDTISGQNRNAIAAFDTASLSLSNWNPVVSNPTAITRKDSIVWVAGQFYDTSFSNPYIRFFAGLNAKTGTIIQAPNLAFGATVNSLLANDIYVIAGGKFSDTTSCGNLLMYNTVTKKVLPQTSFCQTFDNLENGINAMTFIGNDLYFGGSFTDVNGKVNSPNLGRIRYPAGFFGNVVDSVINYSPHTADNGGSVTISFEGELIHSGMKLKLKAAGLSDINSVDSMTSFPAANKMNVILDLWQKATGIYDVIIIDTNGTRYSYPKGFAISAMDSTINYYPHSGGNGGDVTINFSGELIHPGMRIKLVMAGASDINSVDSMTAFSEIGAMNVTLDLRQKALGVYDVIIIDSNGTPYSYPQGFTIEPTIAPKLWVNITGDHVLRIGFNQVYTVTFGNDGNVDANFVPLLITTSKLGTDIQIISSIFRADSILGFNNDSTKYTIDDSELNMSSRLFYLNKICAHSSGSISLIFHLPVTTVLHSYSSIQAIIGIPFPDSTDNLSKFNHRTSIDGDENNLSYFAGCIANLFESVVNGVNDYLDDQTKQCINLTIPDLGNTYTSYAKKFNVQSYLPYTGYYGGTSVFQQGWPTNGMDFLNPNSDYYQAIKHCFLASPNALVPWRKAVMNWMVHKVTESLASHGVGSNCSQGGSWDGLSCLNGNSCDPNEKYGPGDSINGFYLNTEKPITYTVNFENNPTANLDAQTITVIDSLDANYFDYSAFAFTSIVFSDSIYVLNHPVNAFTHDFDFTAQYDVKARVTGSFDTLTGIAKWKFQTINPATNQPTTNAADGILPPDTTSPLGQGYVSFIVRPNKNIGNGDVICNRATIVFDNNPPITTHCWQNTFDLVRPVSKVDSLPPIENRETFIASWKGSDNLSGIKSYDVYVSVNDSVYKQWLSNQTVTTDTFTGKFGNRYSFYSIATDKVGNIEPPKTSAEATTKLININDVLIYPNPNYGSFTVDFNSTLDVKDIALFDLYGKRININLTGASNMFTISISSGSEAFGMYILRIETTQKIINRKIIIEK